MQAAAAWQRLANELTATAASYSSVISGLTGDDWLGPSALSMAAAAVPYVAWMRATAASAEQAAAQAVAAANAYESAYAATVPPTVIAANRRTMLSLVKTNVFGQNTPAIATSEAQYGEMWAQDIVAMEGYAGASAAASQLPPFTPPPATTSGAGSLSDAAATAAQAVVPAAAATDVSLLPTLQSFLPPPFDAIPNPIEDLDVLVAAAVAVAAGSLGYRRRSSARSTATTWSTRPKRRRIAQPNPTRHPLGPRVTGISLRSEDGSPARHSRRSPRSPATPLTSADSPCRTAGIFRQRCAKLRRCSPARLRCI